MRYSVSWVPTGPVRPVHWRPWKASDVRMAGSLHVLGIDPMREPGRLKDAIGVQLQTSGLPGNMKVGEAMRFFCAYHHVAPRLDLIERMGLNEKLNTQYQQLSTGQQRRLALALAVAHRPQPGDPG